MVAKMLFSLSELSFKDVVSSERFETVVLISCLFSETKRLRFLESSLRFVVSSGSVLFKL